MNKFSAQSVKKSAYETTDEWYQRDRMRKLDIAICNFLEFLLVIRLCSQNSFEQAMSSETKLV